MASRYLNLLFLAPLALLASPLVIPKALDPQTQVTKCGFDIAFVLDRSESVTEMNFPLVKKFVKNVIGSMSAELGVPVGGGSAERIQVALVPFNTYANVALYLNQSQTVTDVLNAVDALQYFPGLTNPYDALNKIMTDVFTPAHGDRTDTTNALIYVSDGSRTYGTNDPAALAKQFRSMQNGQIIAVGVEGMNGMHTGVFYDELLSIAGNENNVFNVTNYQGLYGIFKDVAAKLNC